MPVHNRKLSPPVNEAFTSVTVCVPNTTTCQTIDHVLVDTGSSGLRLLSSVLTIPLPQQNDSSGNPLDECTVFLDGYVWGPVAAADISLAGETAASAPVQVMIPDTAAPPVPGSCSSRTIGPNEGVSVSALGANGILGVGLFQQDCGAVCTTANGSIPPVYYDCPASGCNPTYVTLAQQVPNPVTKLSLDNNGVLIFLPSVPAGGVGTVNGSLIFGIGTQSNNALQSATVYTVPDSRPQRRQHHHYLQRGRLSVKLHRQRLERHFLSGQRHHGHTDMRRRRIPRGIAQPHRPTVSRPPTRGPTEIRVSSTSASRMPTVLLNTSNTAFSTLGGPLTGSFDWGLTFFFGKDRVHRHREPEHSRRAGTVRRVLKIAARVRLAFAKWQDASTGRREKS